MKKLILTVMICWSVGAFASGNCRMDCTPDMFGGQHCTTYCY